MNTISIGNAAGFWGDDLAAPRLLCEHASLDYLTLEYLAELTLSILANMKSRNPELGYVTDFPVVVESLILQLQSQDQLKVVTNAGGMNSRGCAAAVADVLIKHGLGHTPMAIVLGDDLMPELDAHIEAGNDFTNLETGEALLNVREKLASANAYLGAGGIVEALKQGARIVITGRVADASLTVGPAVHEFGWSWSDWDRLAAATVAGHLIECGAQVTGGMFSAWDDNPDKQPLSNVGYPIAELTSSGGVEITKPLGTDGWVTTATVAEQLVYEIGDPAHYLTPDVDVDFSNVTLQQVGVDRVAVSGARGGPPPETYKASLSYRDGYMAVGTLVVCGRDAAAKARTCGQIILDRLAREGISLKRTSVECLGAGDSVPGGWQTNHPTDVLLRIAAQDPSRTALERFLRQFAPLVTAGPPGVTGYTGPRPKPYPVTAYWPALISKNHVHPKVETRPAKEWI